MNQTIKKADNYFLKTYNRFVREIDVRTSWIPFHQRTYP